MKRLLWGIVVFLLLAAGLGGYLHFFPSGRASLPESGAVSESGGDLTAYEHLVIDGPFRVTLDAGAPHLRLRAEAAVQQAFAADLRDGRLRVYLTTPVTSGALPELFLQGRGIKTLELYGTSRLEARGGAAPHIRVAAHDAAEADLRFICEQARLEAGGAAVIVTGGLRCGDRTDAVTGLGRIGATP